MLTSTYKQTFLSLMYMQKLFSSHKFITILFTPKICYIYIFACLLAAMGLVEYYKPGQIYLTKQQSKRADAFVNRVVYLCSYTVSQVKLKDILGLPNLAGVILS